ncbi:MAG TPA: tetratricopeptide repeat protein [Steroidobacteraceae bacterium]|jgi:cytochrome c-type biogenesis protein CcmH|nr:tetratricopeptide repeat protein [Steroidobacteraceae bacterium]
MILAFVLIAGTLATAAAVLLLWPLLQRRADARPAAPVAAVIVLVVTLLGGAGLYAGFSSYGWVDQSAVADTPAAMTARLANRLAREPGKIEDWLTLGRSYTVLEQYPLAIRAYQRADRMANGTNVEAIIGTAESMVALDSSTLSGGAGRLFERAMELEPANPKALFYGAFAAMARGELPKARERFRSLLALNPPAEVRAILEKRIADIDAAFNGAGQSEAAAADDTNARIAVHVTLAPALAAKVPAEAPLFVAARDPKSPGPPFAVKRLAARFPVDVELTGADAMMASRRIAAGQQLEVVARVALGGTPTATRGDPFGQVSYHVGSDGKLNIVIDRLAP